MAAAASPVTVLPPSVARVCGEYLEELRRREKWTISYKGRDLFRLMPPTKARKALVDYLSKLSFPTNTNAYQQLRVALALTTYLRDCEREKSEPPTYSRYPSDTGSFGRLLWEEMEKCIIHLEPDPIFSITTPIPMGLDYGKLSKPEQALFNQLLPGLQFHLFIESRFRLRDYDEFTGSPSQFARDFFQFYRPWLSIGGADDNFLFICRALLQTFLLSEDGPRTLLGEPQFQELAEQWFRSIADPVQTICSLLAAGDEAAECLLKADSSCLIKGNLVLERLLQRNDPVAVRYVFLVAQSAAPEANALFAQILNSPFYHPLWTTWDEEKLTKNGRTLVAAITGSDLPDASKKERLHTFYQAVRARCSKIADLQLLYNFKSLYPADSTTDVSASLASTVARQEGTRIIVLDEAQARMTAAISKIKEHFPADSETRHTQAHFKTFEDNFNQGRLPHGNQVENYAHVLELTERIVGRIQEIESTEGAAGKERINQLLGLQTGQLSACPSGASSVLNEMLSSLSSKEDGVISEYLNDLIRAATVKFFREAGLPEGVEVHMPIARILAALGLPPWSQFHSDAFLIDLPSMEIEAIARGVMKMIRPEVLIDKLVKNELIFAEGMRYSPLLPSAPPDKGHLHFLEEQVRRFEALGLFPADCVTVQDKQAQVLDWCFDLSGVKKEDGTALSNGKQIFEAINNFDLNEASIKNLPFKLSKDLEDRLKTMKQRGLEERGILLTSEKKAQLYAEVWTFLTSLAPDTLPEATRNVMHRLMRSADGAVVMEEVLQKNSDRLHEITQASLVWEDDEDMQCLCSLKDDLGSEFCNLIRRCEIRWDGELADAALTNAEKRGFWGRVNRDQVDPPTLSELLTELSSRDDAPKILRVLNCEPYARVAAALVAHEEEAKLLGGLLLADSGCSQALRHLASCLPQYASSFAHPVCPAEYRETVNPLRSVMECASRPLIAPITHTGPTSTGH